MSRELPNISLANDRFQDVFDIVDELTDAFETTVTVVANSTGDVTTGNGHVNGTLSATLVAADTMRGGNVSTSAQLVVSSNLVANGEVFNVAANTTFRAANVTFGNTTIVGLSITSNSTVVAVVLGGNSATLNSNVSFGGKELKVPTGNTSQRPTGVEGLLRLNTETDSLEIYIDGNWNSLLSSVGGGLDAAAIPFTPAGNVGNNDVQTAIEELDTEKVAKVGDTMTGVLNVNRSGGTMPTPATGTVIQIVQEDSAAGIVDVSTFSETPALVGRRSGGSINAKLTVAANDTIVRVGGRAHDGNTYSSVDHGAVDARASQAWTNTAHGARVVIVTTPNETVTPVDTLSVSANGTSVNSDLTVVAGKIFSGNGVGLTSINASSIAAANTTVVGVTQLASNTLVQSGSNNTTAVTPQSLSSTVGVTLQAYDADTAKLDVEDQVLTGGARVTSKSLGTITSGTVTPDPGDRPMQHLIANGAFTLAPGSNAGSYLLDVTFGAGAGLITTSGWTKVVGTFANTNGNKYRCSCSVGNAGSLLSIQALQ
jgi:hypothetical protein